ncbi:hypothetical protein E1B28_000224 [Marasmius oreades]|uniref:Protein kinase domain-containing protein n=1 Tax=Marasmius oreades TaxID=181124 RepID=A0A9P8AE51_9AGAR|nr:uncharacterized protein E1B28_000224 [Marasmius oreades]KAG7098262.1 hypothetical protein E1B28_000224 [Marasmius oreades]
MMGPATPTRSISISGSGSVDGPPVTPPCVADFDNVPGPHSPPPRRTTPEQDDGSSAAAISSTLYGFGTADHDAEKEKNATRSKMAPFSKHDMAEESRHRLTVEEFLSNVFHDPGDEGDKSRLMAIAESEPFIAKLEAYCKKVDDELARYPLYVDLVNTAISAMETQGLTQNELGFMACVNHPVPVRGSRSKHIPDADGVLSKALRLRMVEGKRKTKEMREMLSMTSTYASSAPLIPFMWADLITFIEFKLVSKELTGPAAEKKGPSPSPRNKNSTQRISSTSSAISSYVSSANASTSSGKHQRSSVEDDDSQPNKKQKVEDPVIQCADYAMNMFNRGGIRLHVIGTLITDDKIELFLYTRSGTASASFSFINQPILFLRVLLACSRMSLSQWGFFKTLIPCTLSKTLPPLQKALKPDRKMFSGQKFEVDGTSFEVGDVEMFPRGLIGQGTWGLLVKAISGKLVDENSVSPGEELFMKLSCIASTRYKECDYIKDATKLACGEHAWVLNHLPNVLASGEFPLEISFEELFGDKLERRDLRYEIMEKLYPITELKGKPFAKAFRDIIRCHQWLVNFPKIMHRDVSLNNVMYRKKDGREYGVLNDYDLACHVSRSGEPTSSQRTGTKPFIALELLDGAPLNINQPHYVRFDLESFLYVLAWIVCRFEDGNEIQDAPFDEWMQGTWEQVYNVKTAWLQKPTCSLTKSYKELFGVLLELKAHTQKGHHLLTYHHMALVGSHLGWPTHALDLATLDKNITYSRFISAFDRILD